MHSREIWRMRYELRQVPPAPDWPAGISAGEFALADAAAVHGLLERAYANGGGSVDPFELWLPAMTGDAEYDPALWFTARDSGGALVGVALCWTSAFVKDVAVEREWRGRGLGTALLRHVLHVFAARGAPAVDLKVQSDNPSGAAGVYERAGFTVVERLPA